MYIYILYYQQEDSPLWIVFLCDSEESEIPLNLRFKEKKLEDNLVKIYLKLYLKCQQNMTLLLIHVFKTNLSKIYKKKIMILNLRVR